MLPINFRDYGKSLTFRLEGKVARLCMREIEDCRRRT
jgi:hypothetical protein